MLSNELSQSLSPSFLIGTTLGLTVILAVISVIDFRTFRIPDLLCLPLICTGLAFAMTVSGVYAADYVIGALGAFAFFFGIGEGYFRARNVDGLGIGDAKLFAAAGAWLGWQNLPVVLLIATAGGLLQALVVKKTRRDDRLAFGPWIAFGFWTVWISTSLVA